METSQVVGLLTVRRARLGARLHLPLAPIFVDVARLLEVLVERAGLGGSFIAISAEFPGGCFGLRFHDPSMVLSIALSRQSTGVIDGLWKNPLKIKRWFQRHHAPVERARCGKTFANTVEITPVENGWFNP
jgi:hypothetical protein